MSKKRLIGIIIGLLALLAAGVTAYAVSNYGSQEDPLITKSYLDSVVQPKLEAEVQNQLANALAGIEAHNGSFTVLTLQRGQRVTCAVGTELMLRFGSAAAYASDSADVALVDTTEAAPLSNGAALSVNHLYMVTIQGNGFTAGADNTKILVSGDYSIT